MFPSREGRGGKGKGEEGRVENEALIVRSLANYFLCSCQNLNKVFKPGY